MTRHTYETRSRTARRRLKRRGAALIVAMLVLLMATATAIFALQNTGQEIRAAGSAKQGVQTKYVAEAGVAAVMAWLEVKQDQGSLATLLSGCTPPTDMMEPYYMPDLCIGSDVDQYCFLTADDIENDPDFVDKPLVQDDEVCQVASPYTSDFEVLLEFHCKTVSGTQALLFITASIYGKRELAAASDFRTLDDGDPTAFAVLEDRNSFHSSLSVTRSYYTVNVTSCSLF